MNQDTINEKPTADETTEEVDAGSTAGTSDVVETALPHTDVANENEDEALAEDTSHAQTSTEEEEITSTETVEQPGIAAETKEPATSAASEPAEPEPATPTESMTAEAPAATPESTAPAKETPAPAEETPAPSPKPEPAPPAKPKIPLSELKVGDELTGRVVSIADFGAFVDIGAETDGLIHISELSDKRVEKVSDVVKIGQRVQVWIKDLDVEQERISLSMKPKPKYQMRDLKPGMVVEGKVTSVQDYGVFVDIGAETEGLVHVSEMADDYVSKPAELVSPGDVIEVQIKKINQRRRRISLSMKAVKPPTEPEEEEQEKERPLPTAMELAIRRALGEREEAQRAKSTEQEGSESQEDDRLGDVINRMLQEYRQDQQDESSN